MIIRALMVFVVVIIMLIMLMLLAYIFASTTSIVIRALGILIWLITLALLMAFIVMLAP